MVMHERYWVTGWDISCPRCKGMPRGVEVHLGHTPWNDPLPWLLLTCECGHKWREKLHYTERVTPRGELVPSTPALRKENYEIVLPVTIDKVAKPEVDWEGVHERIRDVMEERFVEGGK